jgi:hypothetical protein
MTDRTNPMTTADAKVELVRGVIYRVMDQRPFVSLGQDTIDELATNILAALEASPHSMTEAMGRDIYEQGYKDGFVDATITEDGYPDEATVLKRVSGVNITEGWAAMQAASPIDQQEAGDDQ